MIIFSDKKDVSSEKNIIRMFFDFKSHEKADLSLAKNIAVRVNEVISKYFEHDKIDPEAANFLNELFFFNNKDFPNFFFVECENVTGNLNGEIILTSENLGILWGLGQRKIIYHISHFVKAVASEFSEILTFREVVVETYASSLTKCSGVNDISMDDKVSNLSLEVSRKLMGNFFSDLSLGKTVILGKDIFPLFGENRPRKDIYPELICCLQECVSNFDLDVSCIYYGDDDDGEEVEFENIVEHFSNGEGIYDMERGVLIKDFNFDKLGVSIYKRK